MSPGIYIWRNDTERIKKQKIHKYRWGGRGVSRWHLYAPFLVQSTGRRQTVQKYILAGVQFFWTVQNETVIRPEEFSFPFSSCVCVCAHNVSSSLLTASSRVHNRNRHRCIRLLPPWPTAKSAYRKTARKSHVCRWRRRERNESNTRLLK